MRPTILTSAGFLLFLLFLWAALAVFYGFVYRRESHQARRLLLWQSLLLWALRLVVATLGLLALARPALNLVETRERKPVVAFLVDDSASMNFPSAPGDPEVKDDPRERRTRFDSAQASVQKLQEKLTRTHRCLVYTFSDTQKLLKELRERGSDRDPRESRTDVFDPKLRAGGEYTNLGDALQDVMRDLSSDKISAIVVVSDGRQTGGVELATAVKQAADAKPKVPLFVVAKGTEFPLRDLRIDEVIVGAEHSQGDVLTFVVKVTNQISSRLETKLTLLEEGNPAAAKSVVLKRGEDTVSIAMIPEVEGLREFRLRLPTFPDEVNTENNEAKVHVKIVKRTLRVILIAGKPSREYFYMVPALLRDPVVEVSCYLQCADVDYVQQGNRNIDRLPSTSKEWQPYDVAVLHDVDPNGITTAQIAGLEEMVNKGGGLVVIAGRNNGLAKLVQVHAALIRNLLPIEVDKNLYPDYDAYYETAFKTERTPAGKGHPVMFCSSDEKLNEELWTTFPSFYWFHPVVGAKPQSVVLLEHYGSGVEKRVPLMAIQRYGEGAVFLTAIDSFWLWRYPYESYDYDRFWVRVIRYLGETRLHGAQQQVALRTDRQSYSPGEKVRVTLQVLDPALMKQLEGQPVYSSVTTPREAKDMVQLRPRADGTPVYESTYSARSVGSHVVQVRQIAPEADSDQKPLFEAKTSFMVKMQSLEDKDTSADLEALRNMAEKTGGKYTDYKTPELLSEMPKYISPERQVLTKDIQVEAWSGPPLRFAAVFLALFLVLISGEWCLRKWWGLL